MGAFADLNRLIHDTYDREVEKAKKKQKKSKRKSGGSASAVVEGRSIDDLTDEECLQQAQQAEDAEKSTLNHPSLLRIVTSWKKLTLTLMEKEVFLEYTPTLFKGFQACLPEGAQDETSALTKHFDHVETLLLLLNHTAQHAAADDSTECRFVTLLEILVSYTPQWTPSEAVSKLWIRLMQRIPYQCEPLTFRRKAYRVLVSLSWVPSSKGLLQACSIDERPFSLQPLPTASLCHRTSAAVSDWAVVPRHDSVNQLLDRLKDETDVCVAISSETAGMGKATLASLVVSHPSIRKSFFVVWIRLTDDTSADHPHNHNRNQPYHMSFETYCDYMTQVRDQIREQQIAKNESTLISFTFPRCEQRFEEPAVRQLREAQAIDETKRQVTRALLGKQPYNGTVQPNKPPTKLLLVLENVTHEAQIPLFRFHDQQSLLVITNPNGSGSNGSLAKEALTKVVDWQVVLDPLSPAEALDLFLQQAGIPAHQLDSYAATLGETAEVQQLLEQDCHWHPLLIRTVARWCRLKSISGGLGPVQACREIWQEMQQLAVDQMNEQSTTWFPSVEAITSSGTVLNSSNLASNHNKDNDSFTSTSTSEGLPSTTTASGLHIPSDAATIKTSRFLFDILSLLMGPARHYFSDADTSEHEEDTSAVFVVCFAAMAVVFSRRRVPLDMVLLLWEQLLVVEPLAADEFQELYNHHQTLRKKKSKKKKDAPSSDDTDNNKDDEALARRRFVGLIAQGLWQMGVVEIYSVSSRSSTDDDDEEDEDDDEDDVWIEIHHELYAQFGLAMAEELDLGDSFDETVQEWHKAFVTSYFAQRIQQQQKGKKGGGGGKNSLAYAVRCLPTHIFQAGMMKMAETILTDRHFLETRVATLGWPKAIQVHIADCMQLQNRLHEEIMMKSYQSMESGGSAGNNNTNANALMISPVFGKTMDMLHTVLHEHEKQDDKEQGKKDATMRVNVASALYRMAFSLAEHGYFEEALTQFDAAQKLIPNEESVSLQASIQYGMSWVLLVSGDSKRALRKIGTALQLMQENGHLLYKEARQLQIDTLYERCEYKQALELLDELESELLMDGDYDNAGYDSMIELGAVLKKKGGMLQVMGKTAEAIAAYTAAIEWKEKADECSYGLASVFCQLGDAELEGRMVGGKINNNSSTSAAKEALEQAITTLVRVQCEPEHVNYLLATGKTKFLKSDFTQCLVSLELAREAIGVTPLYLMDQSAYDLRCIAQIYQAVHGGNATEAIQVLQESLVLTQHRPQSLERASGLDALGKCLLERQRLREGLHCLQESLHIKQEHVGPHSLPLLKQMHRIAHVHHLLQDFVKALDMYSQASRLLQHAAPADTEQAAHVLFCRGAVLESQAAMRQAEHDVVDCTAATRVYQVAMERLAQTHASDDATIGKGHLCLGRAWARVTTATHSQHADEARHALSEAIRIYTLQYDERQLLDAHYWLGVLYRRLGKWDAAEASLFDALKLAKKRSGGEGSTEHLQTRLQLAHNCRLSGQDEQALTLYQDCLQRLESDDDDDEQDDSQKAGTGPDDKLRLELRGHLYQALGHVKLLGMEETDALKYYGKAHEWRLEHGHDRLAERAARHSLRGLGLTQLLFCHNDAAIATLEKLFNQESENHKERLQELEEEEDEDKKKAVDLSPKKEKPTVITANRDYLLALIFLGDAYFASQRADEAVALWKEAQAEDKTNDKTIGPLYQRRLALSTAGSEDDDVSLDLAELKGLQAVIFVDD